VVSAAAHVFGVFSGRRALLWTNAFTAASTHLLLLVDPNGIDNCVPAAEGCAASLALSAAVLVAQAAHEHDHRALFMLRSTSGHSGSATNPPSKPFNSDAAAANIGPPNGTFALIIREESNSDLVLTDRSSEASVISLPLPPRQRRWRPKPVNDDDDTYDGDSNESSPDDGTMKTADAEAFAAEAAARVEATFHNNDHVAQPDGNSHYCEEPPRRGNMPVDRGYCNSRVTYSELLELNEQHLRGSDYCFTGEDRRLSRQASGETPGDHSADDIMQYGLVVGPSSIQFVESQNLPVCRHLKFWLSARFNDPCS
jgi:hypothetical protein